jgi:hypothetical protein
MDCMYETASCSKVLLLATARVYGFIHKLMLTAGISGCHLLCSGFSCSHGFLEMSTLIRGVGVRGGMLLLLLLVLSHLFGRRSLC